MRILIAVVLLVTLASPVCAATAPEAGVPAESTPVSTLSEPVGFGEYLRMFAGLAVILVLIVGMAWAMRRMGRFTTGGQGALRIVAGLSLGQRERVVVLQVGEEQILVGISPGGIHRLHTLEAPLDTSETGNAAAGSDSFAARLAAVLRGQGGGT